MAPLACCYIRRGQSSWKRNVRMPCLGRVMRFSQSNERRVEHYSHRSRASIGAIDHNSKYNSSLACLSCLGLPKEERYPGLIVFLLLLGDVLCRVYLTPSFFFPRFSTAFRDTHNGSTYIRKKKDRRPGPLSFLLNGEPIPGWLAG